MVEVSPGAVMKGVKGPVPPVQVIARGMHWITEEGVLTENVV